MRPLKFFLAVLAFFLMLSGRSSAEGPATVSSIRYSSGKTGTTIEIEADKKPQYRVNRALTPLSVQIELNGAVLSPHLPQFLPVNDGRVKGIESFQYAKEAAKVTIGLESSSAFTVSSVETGGFVITIEVTEKFPSGVATGGKDAP